MRYPTRLLGNDEEVVDLFRPHGKKLVPAVAWAMLLAAVAGVVLAVLDRGWDPGSAAVVAVAIALWALLAARRVVRWWSTRIVLTTERIVVRTGVLSRSGTEIPLDSIDNVHFAQGLADRLLGSGDVLIESGGGRGRTRLRDIPRPEAFQSEIYWARGLRWRDHLSDRHRSRAVLPSDDDAVGFDEHDEDHDLDRRR